jgi:hypothetical protein
VIRGVSQREAGVGPRERRVQLDRLPRAAELAGDSAKAREYYAKLTALGETADSSQTEVETAKRFLARR